MLNGYVIMAVFFIFVGTYISAVIWRSDGHLWVQEYSDYLLICVKSQVTVINIFEF